MRGISLTALLILSAQGFCNAATFDCEFSPKTGSQNNFSCKVDTSVDWHNEQTKCRQDYSSTLFGQCDGRSPGGTNQLICYFASPTSPPNLDANSIIGQAGVYSVGVEWIGFPPSTASIVLENK